MPKYFFVKLFHEFANQKVNLIQQDGHFFKRDSGILKCQINYLLFTTETCPKSLPYMTRAIRYHLLATTNSA